jgi:hypothetical protein
MFRRRNDMRASRKILPAVIVIALMATTLGLVAPFARAIDVTRIVREGQLLEMSFTEITVHEEDGKYTYQLGPTGRWTLDALGIVPGDRIRYTVYGSSGYAHDFQKLSK